MPEKTQTKELPIDIIELMNSKKTSEEIAAICFLNGLNNEEETEKATYQVLRVLLGESPPQKLEQELKNKEGFSSGLSKNIAKDVNIQIFDEVKVDLQKLYQQPYRNEKLTQPLKKLSEKENEQKDDYRENV